jgi:hypothetical protein
MYHEINETGNHRRERIQGHLAVLVSAELRRDRSHLALRAAVG